MKILAFLFSVIYTLIVMTDGNSINSQDEAFLHSIEDVIKHAVRTLDLNKIHDLSPEELHVHFDLITEESWEDYSFKVKDLDAFKRATLEVLQNFKTYYDCLATDEDSSDQLKQKLQNIDFKAYLKSFLTEGFNNQFSIVAINQGLMSEKETSSEIELAQSFNAVSKNLVLMAQDIFQNQAIDRMNDDQITALAGEFGEVLSNSLNQKGAPKTICTSILTNQLEIVLVQLKTEIEEGKASESNLQVIYDQAQHDTLNVLLDVAERTNMISKDIRDRNDLSFKPPKRTF